MGEVVPGGIAETMYRRLGGLDQWVMIRGDSVANPPLILLHGGPGFSETRFFRLFNTPLEKSFTVAPMKKLLWFERSGHEPFADEPAKFNAAMAELVLPVVHIGATRG